MGLSIGDGAMIGLDFASLRNAQDAQRERARLHALINEETAQGHRETALKDGAKAVVNAMMTELAAEAAGAKGVRRLSDPANLSGRNAAFMDAAQQHLNRLSEGKLKFSPMDVQRSKTQTLKWRGFCATRT